jgi:hypothetical protein
MPDISSFLQGVVQGATQPKGMMGDFTHASRLYVDNVFSLAPKASWIYYVVFDINPAAITDTTWNNQKRTGEVGMLVKATDLPKFTIQSEVVNQYNKKSVIHKNITYNPISMSLHDDQSNVVHNMWINYYRYYFSDAKYAGVGPIGTAKDNRSGAFTKGNQYATPNNLFGPTDFGLNSSLVNEPFFRSINIFQMNRKVFTSYVLVNPLITAWEHDRMDQTSVNRLNESKMTVAYEAVLYGAGRVKKDTPSGFATFHYDNSPSPLSIAGGGNSSLFGPGGVIPGSLEVFGDVSGILDPDSKTSPLDILQAGIKGANLVRNIKNITKDGLRAEGYQLLNNTIKSIGNGSLGLGLGIKIDKSAAGIQGEYKGTPITVAPPKK